MDYKINLADYHFTIEQLKIFYGFQDENIKLLEKNFHCEIRANSEIINIQTKEENIDMIETCIKNMVQIILKNADFDKTTMQELIQRVLHHQNEVDENIRYVTTYNGKVIRPKNVSQMHYYHLLENNTIVFAMGAAGTGKTYLAVAYGVSLLKSKKVSKIIVTRPIVEAGENLGYLPGELKEKVDPYLTPIYDSFNEIIGKEATEKYLDKGIIEIAPLAYMRGRTLNDAFVILDEAQNTTSTQMKMFLTRLGYHTRMVITGDESQIDLKSSIQSGIIIASKILQEIDDIGFIRFDSKDVIRHPLVSKIIQAYEKLEK